VKGEREIVNTIAFLSTFQSQRRKNRISTVFLLFNCAGLEISSFFSKFSVYVIYIKPYIMSTIALSQNEINLINVGIAILQQNPSINSMSFSNGSEILNAVPPGDENSVMVNTGSLVACDAVIFGLLVGAVWAAEWALTSSNLVPSLNSSAITSALSNINLPQNYTLDDLISARNYLNSQL
jgi:hypothetical protein